MLIALFSFVCYTLKLMFEESCIFGSKAHGFFLRVGFFNYLFLFTRALKKTKNSTPLIWQKGVKFLIWMPIFAGEVP